jgi:hypothetical protein
VGPDGSPQGVTATGQASVRGQGTAVRDQAIRQAVADARDQAETAAQAAGVTLGQVIDMQVSAPGYPYPLAGEATQGSAAPTPVPAPSAVPGSTTCSPPPTCIVPPSKPVPGPIPIPTGTFVSVTVTWAIAG